MPSLHENAARMANGEQEPSASDAPPVQTPLVEAPTTEPLPDPGIPTPGKEGPEKVDVFTAWSRVMETVRFAAKDEKVTEGRQFSYRGIDKALNLFGAACRLHGVLVIPVKVETAHRDTQTSRGNPTRECMVTVTYRIYGPDGSHFEAQAAGEALDNSDKGTAQAQAVALRTMLYHAGLVPTRDPDPDSTVIERGEAPLRTAVSYRDEILDQRTSKQRMLQIKWELEQAKRLGEKVQNESGDDEAIGALVNRIGRERFPS